MNNGKQETMKTMKDVALSSWLGKQGSDKDPLHPKRA